MAWVSAGLQGEEEASSAQDRAEGRAGAQLCDGAARSHAVLMSATSVSTAGTRRAH